MISIDTEGMYTLAQMLLEQRRAEAAQQRLVQQLNPRGGVVHDVLSATRRLVALALRAIATTNRAAPAKFACSD